MKYTPINCWRIHYDVPDTKALEEKTPTFQIFKKSILKTGYRGYMLSDQDFDNSDWYQEFMLQEDVRFYIEGSGVYSIANIDLSENEIYFERRGVPIGWQPWIYYCWQSDFPESRNEILQALQSAADKINANHDPIRDLQVIESLEPGEGAVNIRLALERNLLKSLLAVFDITNVAKALYRERYMPNGNVSYELGLASTKKRPNQMILVKKINAELPQGEDDVLFDFEQTKRIEYRDIVELNEKLENEIRDILVRMKYLRVE